MSSPSCLPDMLFSLCLSFRKTLSDPIDICTDTRGPQLWYVLICFQRRCCCGSKVLWNVFWLTVTNQPVRSRPAPTSMTPRLDWMRPPLIRGCHLTQPDRRIKGRGPLAREKARVASEALTFWDAADEILWWDDRSERVDRGKLWSREINREKEVGQMRWGEGKRGSGEWRGEAGGWGGLSGYSGP